MKNADELILEGKDIYEKNKKQVLAHPAGKLNHIYKNENYRVWMTDVDYLVKNNKEILSDSEYKEYRGSYLNRDAKSYEEIIKILSCFHEKGL